MQEGHDTTAAGRSRWSVGVLALTAVVIGLTWMQPAQGAAPDEPPTPDELIAQLDCDERSRDADGQVLYEVSVGADYPEELQSTETPESIAADAAPMVRPATRMRVRDKATGQQLVRQEQVRRRRVFRSPERVDVALQTSDGRTVGIVTAVDEGDGWQHAGAIACGIAPR